MIHNKKLEQIAKIIGITLLVYVSVKWILPLLWPIIAGFVIAKIISPVVRLLVRKANFSKNVAIYFAMTVFVVIVCVAAFFFGRILFEQIVRFVNNWNVIIPKIDEKVKGICCGIEEGLHLKSNCVYPVVCDNVVRFISESKEEVLSALMNNSVPVLIYMIEIVAVIIVTIVSGFFFLRDEEKIKDYLDNFMFAKEAAVVTDTLKFVFKAYFKAQLIIMIITTAICFIGFYLMGNQYSLLVAIIVSVLDMLPLIGIGIILVPWAIICFIMGNINNALILIAIFLICYVLREILEPRLIGDKVGLSPIASLTGIYVGYKLFGLIGVVLGPIAYLIIKEAVKS